MTITVLPMLFDPSNILMALQPFYFASAPPVILGLVFLGITRDFLFRNRLHDYNTLKNLNTPSSCTHDEHRFRTYDGHCNNLQHPGMGTKGGRFGRSALKDPLMKDPDIMHPNPYLVAERLLRSKDGQRQAAAPFNMWLSSWININLHDWIFHDTVPEDPYTLQWGPSKNDTFRLRRTALDAEGFTTNTQTPWWDASQIYGSSEKAARSLRQGEKCELHLDETGNLPLGPDGMPQGGFVINWWTGVEILQNLIVKEHNLVCGMLRALHAELNEDELFETSRLVVAAVVAKIHTTEWTPALLNNELMNVTMRQNWMGMSAAFLEDEQEKLKSDNSLISKLGLLVHQAVLHVVPFLVRGTSGVGHTTELYNSPYSLSEDFVSSYRMHPLIPDVFHIDGQQVKAADMVNQKARSIIDRFGLSKLMHAWGHQPPTALTLHNYPNFLTHLEVPGEDGPRNMAVVDILRDRERGMVRYNQARRQYGLKPYTKFEEITDNADWVQDLKSVYDSIEEVDYLVGCLAESPRPSGYVISNTAFYVFIMNASRRILCDRFYQESYNAATYTSEGLEHVKASTFKALLLRHYPELEASIGDVPNAFLAWTGTSDYGSLQHLEPGGCTHSEL